MIGNRRSLSTNSPLRPCGRALGALALATLALPIAILVLAACAPSASVASPSPTATASPASASPTQPRGAIPTVPVGRSVGGETQRPDDVRTQGTVLDAAGGPARRVCVTVGPVPRCVVLTDDEGNFVIDLPQGAFQWTLRFWRDTKEIASPITIRGPFESNSVSVGRVQTAE